ncbi:MAG: NAD(P)H-hydrate dehydratase [Candidatus Thermoplasmatota archaeon]|nr:NAD(P)H-hydrate dehydratase [Candidatus Thermoplasmatota archaeon]
MLSVQEMRVLDANLEYHGVSIETLMERAGKGIAKVLLERMEAEGARVLILSGTGNNAGDGFVAARFLKDQAQVTVALAKPREATSKGPAQVNLGRLPPEVKLVEPPLEAVALVDGADILVDGLMGTGIQGALREPYRALVEAMNASGKPILSIDMPSGLGSDRVVSPTVTVALHRIKEGMDSATSGDVVVVDIGITAELERMIGPGELLYYPRPGADAHKGDSGRVLVVAGGPFTGAPSLSAMAAYRMGTDVVHVATPTRSAPIVSAFSPTLIVHPLSSDRLVPEDVPVLLELAGGMDAVIIGPGLGRDEATLEAVRRFLRELDKPVSVDADGITAVAGDLTSVQGKSGVITPHVQEFYRLSGVELADREEERLEQVASFAKELGLTVLQKGRHDIVSDGRSTKVNVTGNPGMTVGGTGDVLAGLVGALLGKGVEPFNAARIAAFANGFAGDIAFRELSYGMTATDLLDRIPAVLIEFV